MNAAGPDLAGIPGSSTRRDRRRAGARVLTTHPPPLITDCPPGHRRWASPATPRGGRAGPEADPHAAAESLTRSDPRDRPTRPNRSARQRGRGHCRDRASNGHPAAHGSTANVPTPPIASNPTRDEPARACWRRRSRGAPLSVIAAARRTPSPDRLCGWRCRSRGAEAALGGWLPVRAPATHVPIGCGSGEGLACGRRWRRTRSKPGRSRVSVRDLEPPRHPGSIAGADVRIEIKIVFPANPCILAPKSHPTGRCPCLAIVSLPERPSRTICCPALDRHRGTRIGGGWIRYVTQRSWPRGQARTQPPGPRPRARIAVRDRQCRAECCIRPKPNSPAMANHHRVLCVDPRWCISLSTHGLGTEQ